MILVIYFDVYINNIVKQLTRHGISFMKIKYNTISDFQQLNNIIDKQHIDTVIFSGSQQRILQIPTNLCYLDVLINNPKIKRIIGICFGWQYIAKIHKGTLAEDALFKGYKTTKFNKPLWFNHHDYVTQMPKNTWIIYDTAISQSGKKFINVATSRNGRFIGFQHHPEKQNADFDFFILPFLYGTAK